MRREPGPTPIPPTELALVSFDAAGSWNEAEDALIDRFTDGQPNVSFDRATYVEPPTSYFSLPHLPDLMVISPGYQLDRSIQARQLLELTDLWEQSGLIDQYPAAFRALSAVDDRQYYLPVAYTWSAIYYNTEVFTKYALEPPSTWEEFVAVCDTLLVNGITPLSIAGNDVFLSTLWLDYLDLRLNGLDFHRELTDGRIAYEDDRVRDVLELWAWMIDRGYFVEHPERLSASDSLMAVVSTPEGITFGDRAAMTLTSPTWLGSIPESLRAGLDFFPFPTIDPDVPSTETLTAYGYMIPAGAESQDAALSFVEFAGSSDAQEEMALLLNAGSFELVPANAVADLGDLPESVQRGSAIVSAADGVAPFFVLAVPDSLWNPVGRAIGYFLQYPWDEETTIQMLEEARQKSIAAGDFLSAD